MASISLARLQTSLGHMRWAFGVARATCPWLCAIYGFNALIIVFFPAGFALSVRGLVDSVSTAMAGIPLADTDAYFWLICGLATTLAGSAGGATNRYLNRRLSIELGRRLHLDILRHHETMPFAQIEQQYYLT